jgi:hypothetical protein
MCNIKEQRSHSIERHKGKEKKRVKKERKKERK